MVKMPGSRRTDRGESLGRPETARIRSQAGDFVLPQTHAQIWGTLKRYLAYTAAGFVILGGVGAIESVQPAMVGPAKASETPRDSAPAQALLLNNAGDQPSWMQRLRFDLTSPIAAAERVIERQPATATPYYPAPDTAWMKEADSAAATQAEPAQQIATARRIVLAAAVPPAPIEPSRTSPQPKKLAQIPDSKAPTESPRHGHASAKAATPSNSATRALVATLNWVYTGVDDPTINDNASPDDAEAETPDAATDPAAVRAGSSQAASNPTDTAQTDTAQADATQTDATQAGVTQTAEVPQDAAFESTGDIAGEQRVIEVHRGDTLFGLLTKAGLTEAEAQAAGHSLADVFSPSNLKVGQEITLDLASATNTSDADSSGKLIALKLTPSVERDVKLTRGTDGQFVAAAVVKPLTERIERIAGSIDGSLYDSAHDAGVPASLIGEIIKSFSYDVDFQRDIHEGDSFEAMYERFDADNGDLAKVGNLLYASLTLGGKPLAIYYFEHDGNGEYYTSDGNAVRKSLLKTPVDGARITSGFGMRVNPILGYTLMHKGIDFGAPTGTPIFAAGNGTLEFVGRKNGYGNYIKMRHNSTYETAYGHISKFARGMKPGTKVKQGQVIAYVGATGRATGPHLHFEIIINGKQVNPASVKTVASDRLTGKTLAAFKAQVATIDAERRNSIQRNEIADRTGNATVDCTGQHGCTN
jgi:murein DD-endopeptidase MepM/ murein hydrolase activator NlpD